MRVSSVADKNNRKFRIAASVVRKYWGQCMEHEPGLVHGAMIPYSNGHETLKAETIALLLLPRQPEMALLS